MFVSLSSSCCFKRTAASGRRAAGAILAVLMSPTGTDNTISEMSVQRAELPLTLLKSAGKDSSKLQHWTPEERAEKQRRSSSDGQRARTEEEAEEDDGEDEETNRPSFLWRSEG